MSERKVCSPNIATLNKKSLNRIVLELAKLYNLTEEQQAKLYDLLVKLGFEFAAISGLSFPLDNFDIPPEIQEYKKKLTELAREGKIDEYEKTLKEALKWLEEYEKKMLSDIYMLNDSGAAKGWGNTQNFKIARGYFVNLREQLISEPVNSALAEGVTPKEYFKYGHAARKGITDRVRYTQEPGYLYRQFEYTMVGLRVVPGTKCKPKALLPISVDEKLIDRILYRYAKVGNRDVLITPDNKSDFIGKRIHLYTPIYCTLDKGICERCYGKRYEQFKSLEIGSVAAQAIGERLYTALLKSFHKGAKGNVVQYTVVEFAKKAIDNAKKLLE